MTFWVTERGQHFASSSEALQMRADVQSGGLATSAADMYKPKLHLHPGCPSGVPFPAALLGLSCPERSNLCWLQILLGADVSVSLSGAGG